MRILGSRPLLVPTTPAPPAIPLSISTVHSRAQWEELVVDATDGVQSVPTGYTLVTLEHGFSPDAGEARRREWPAGSSFHLVRLGDPSTLTVVDVLSSAPGDR